MSNFFYSCSLNFLYFKVNSTCATFSDCLGNCCNCISLSVCKYFLSLSLFFRFIQLSISIELNSLFPPLCFCDCTPSYPLSIQLDLQGALNRWCHRTLRSVSYAPVGLNPYTEHYSALQAEVPDLADANTMPNDSLLTSLAKAEHLIVAGESLSHGLAATVYDIAALLGPSAVRKITLLTDCTSPMAGFEEMGKRFLADLVSRGMRVAKSTELQLV